MRLTADMQRVVREQALGFVATVRADSTPSLSPKGTTTVWDDEHLAFLHLHSEGTVANLESNPRAEVNVVDPVRRKGYRFAGRAEVMTSGPCFEEALARYERERGTDRRSVKAVVLIEVTDAQKLVSPACGYAISTDRTRLDIDVVHDFLRTAYWSRGFPLETVKRAIAHSLCFGLYAPGGKQAGFARVVTDEAVIAYIGDVFMLSEHRGRGLGVWLIETVLSHADLQALRRVELATADAHELYARFGFRPFRHPERQLVIERSPEELYGD